MDRTSVYKGFLVSVIVLLILILFCLFNLEAGTASYYLCVFSFIIDIPFLIFLLFKIRKETKEMSDKQ
jgi:hypothetical protein